MSAPHRPSYLRGAATLAALAGLTWLELLIDGRQILTLLLVGAAKAGLILQIFMHFSRLWAGDR